MLNRVLNVIQIILIEGIICRFNKVQYNHQWCGARTIPTDQLLLCHHIVLLCRDKKDFGRYLLRDT